MGADSALVGRRAGVLLHITSLPSSQGLGTMGPEARRFIDWLADTGFSVWQILPLMPPHEDLSPYLGLSSFAGNSRLIDVASLQDDEVLRQSWVGQELRGLRGVAGELLAQLLAERIQNRPLETLPAAVDFLRRNQFWLPDYATFMVLRDSENGASWLNWREPLREREIVEIEKLRMRQGNLYRAYLLEQYLFDRQWRALKNYANSKGIYLFGDAPLYVAHDSADVWAHRGLFKLDAEGKLVEVAGTPPDMFAEAGQIWGNPVFDWPAAADEKYRWWVARIERQLSLCDILRIDHFRGLQAYWSIPAGGQTASGGRWVEAPGAELLERLRHKLGLLPLVAEDLGYITEAVDRLREEFGLPSMRVLQFGFDGSPDNPHLPHNTPENAVAYTGTHDNDTILGWYSMLPSDVQAYVQTTLNMQHGDSIRDAMIAAVLHSPARLAVLPIQDIFGLGSEGRMNTPATVDDNWRWQFGWDQLQSGTSGRYRQLLRAAGRS